MTQITDEIVEALGLASPLYPGSKQDAGDDLILSPLLVGNTRFGRALTDGAALTEMTLNDLAKVVTERLGLADRLTPNEKFGRTLVDALLLTEALRATFPRDITDAIAVADPHVTTIAMRMIERLKLAEVYAPQMIYGLTITQAMRLTDLARRFFGGEVIDGFEVTDAIAWTAALTGRLTDGVGIADTLTQHFILRAVCAETIEIADAELLQMIFAGKLVEGVQITAAHAAPNGALTTWAVNTQTGAVSEYANYPFNSFAQTGQKYLGAASDGLYELDGDDDAGDPIIARIKSGFMQFGQMHLNTIKGVYLGVRGAGEFFLKIEDGNKHVTTYRALARDFETTRVRTGKGLRARFFRFELVSTGQDFDLEAVEFIPIVQARRT